MAGDYYATLGVAKGSSKQDIKSAYRRLARQFHPDVNKDAGAEDKFKSISEAYEILSDDDKRSVYDQFGEAGLKGAAGMGGAGAYTTNPFDLFESFFGGSMGGMGGMGGGRRTARAVQGDDVRVDMTLDFTEAVFGADKDFEAGHLETCGACSGSGSRAGTSRKTCATCGGMGQVMRTQQTPFGAFSQVSTCSTCGGEGEVISDYCRKCGGEGRVRVKKSIKLKIPAGVNSGSALRVRGEGDAGPRGGPPGDLYVYVQVREHPDIQRDGINLYSKVPIDFTDAILGTVVKVKTVEGTMDLQVPAGTQPGDVLVLAKMGVPKLTKPAVRGDHFFSIKVGIPTRLSDSEKELVTELASIHKSGLRGRTRTQESNLRQASTGAVETQNGASSSEQNGGVLGSIRNAAG
eukprot:SM000207S06201  [mRNA]  locus=s207:161333:163962:- [translate_table: standard]